MPQMPLAIWLPPQLHIPDGFLSLTVSLLFWLIAIFFIVVAARKVQHDFDDRLTPLMGILAAFIFAAQMLNFPIAGGTSGHLLGGALAAILLGPWAAILVMAAVIGAQALLFQDGGFLVMGANIFNMGILTALIGFGLYRSAVQRSLRIKLIVAAVAAWVSVMAGALSVSLQLWLSGTSSLQIVLPAMLGVHAFIGIGEALITAGALAFIFKTRPDLVADAAVRERGGKGWIVAGAAIVLITAILAPLASTNPDGLERVANNLGFIHAAREAPFQILPDYTIPILGETPLSTILAGLIGATLVGFAAILMIRLLRRTTAGAPEVSEQ